MLLDSPVLLLLCASQNLSWKMSITGDIFHYCMSPRHFSCEPLLDEARGPWQSPIYHRVYIYIIYGSAAGRGRGEWEMSFKLIVHTSNISENTCLGGPWGTLITCEKLNCISLHVCIRDLADALRVTIGQIIGKKVFKVQLIAWNGKLMAQKEHRTVWFKGISSVFPEYLKSL